MGGRRGALEGEERVDVHRLYYLTIYLFLLGRHDRTRTLPTLCITRCVAILACYLFGIISGDRLQHASKT